MKKNSQLVNQVNQPPLPILLEQVGEVANHAASRYRFSDYRTRRAAHTVRRQDADIKLFTEFLYSTGIKEIGDLTEDPSAWRGITWGLVEAFVKWQLKEGYAVTSVNVRLSTIKTYAKLAFQAGSISAENYSLIRSVQGYSRREKRRIDAHRTIKRVGLKKESPVVIDSYQAKYLKSCHGEKPQGKRDALLMCLLLDHGLRAGEISGLMQESIDTQTGLIRFFRSKVGKNQVHRMSQDTLRAAKDYLKILPELSPNEPLLCRSWKNGDLGRAGLTTRAISQRVEALGKEIGLAGLSAHDCRHYWATLAARSGTDPFSLQQAGGWSSLAMPRRYVEDNDIANEGVNIDLIEP